MEAQPISKEQVELILTGLSEDVDKFINQESDVTDSQYGSASMTWLEEKTTW